MLKQWFINLAKVLLYSLVVVATLLPLFAIGMVLFLWLGPLAALIAPVVGLVIFMTTAMTINHD